MAAVPRLDIIGAALGDQSRVRIVCELMDGRAHTGKELGCAVGIAPNTVSDHLKRLQDAELIVSIRSGRTVYHRIASQQVADLLEQMSALSPTDHLRRPGKGRHGHALLARTCYNHLAGRLSVLIAEQLFSSGALVERDGGISVDPAKADTLARLGLWPLAKPANGKALAKCCLDWTERKPHISGAIGIAMLKKFLDEKWLLRNAGNRALTITPEGQAALNMHFGISDADLSQ